MLLIVEILFIILLAMILLMLYQDERFSRKKKKLVAQVESYWREKDRRKCTRFRKELDVNYTVEKKLHLRNKVKTLDISQSGIRLILDEKLANGTIIDLEIAIPNSKMMVEAEGEVVWSDEIQDRKGPDDKRLFRAGVRFLAIRGTTEAMLSEYICSLCEER